MQKCPFCAEDIQDKAVKCKHCGEFLAATDNPRLEKDRMPWYFRTSFIVFAVACVGPLALPLIWWRPDTSRAWKTVLTIGIVVLSWLLFRMTVESLHTIREYYHLLEQL